MCRRKNAADARAVLLYRLRTMAADSAHVYFGTLTTPNIRTAQIGGRVDDFGGAWTAFSRRAKRVGVCGSFRALEIAVADEPEYENLHYHLALVTDSNAVVAPHEWQHLWFAGAGRVWRGAHVELARSVDRVARYCCKSHPKDFFREGQLGIADPSRYLERLAQTRNRQRFRAQGVLDTPVMPAEELSQLLYPNRKSYIEAQARIARFPPIPIEREDGDS